MEFLLEILIEILTFPVVELFSARWRKKRASDGKTQGLDPLAQGALIVVFGLILGLVSALVFKARILPGYGFRGMSLILAPLLGGLLLQGYGLLKKKHNKSASFLATFPGGALFAFSISLARFLLVGKI